MNSSNKQPALLLSAVRAATTRLEESCAVIDALEVAWHSPNLSDDARLSVVIHVRRSLIDVIAGLDDIPSHSE